MEITLGFSPCPNDTFIFDALINNRIDTQGLRFKAVLEDVETLNKWAFDEKLNVSKLSYHAYAHVRNKYALLNAGSALGNNCGPLLIAKAPLEQGTLFNKKIAIPGKYTTAAFLLGYYCQQAKNLAPMLFSEIEDAVLSGKVDAGVIIHENRFTYQDKGLVKIIDLGEYWEQQTKHPIPLGGIAIQRHLDTALKSLIDSLIRQSVEYAFANPEASKEYVKAHSQEMDENVMQQHINLYVNHYSANLGEKGKEAVSFLFKSALEKKLIPDYNEDLFI